MSSHAPVQVWFAPPATVLGDDDGVRPGGLDDADLAHIGRFRFARDRQIATASRWLQRHAIGRASGEPCDAALRFTPDAQGRPWIRAPASLAAWHFSAANTPGLVGCAVDLRGPIGLDVECLVRTLAPELVAHCCNAQEQRALHALPEMAQPPAFHALWTRKEAYLKARGIGLALEPRRISFGPAVEHRWPVLLDGSAAQAGDWDVIDLPAGDAHAAALCVPAAWQAASPTITWVLHRHDAVPAEAAAG